jgi:hypothetical protein
MDRTAQSGMLQFDLTTALRNLAIGWKLTAGKIRDDAEARYQGWLAQTAANPSGIDAGLNRIAFDERAWQGEVADYFDRAAAQALGEAPALLVSNNPRIMRHQAAQDAFNGLGAVYAAADVQGRIVEDRPAPPPAAPNPEPFGESRDQQLARQAFDEQLRRAVEAVRSVGMEGIELSATLARDPAAMAELNRAQVDFLRRARVAVS